MPISAISAQARAGTAAEWAASTLILGDGEVGFDTTNNIFKTGDGTNTWANLGTGPGEGVIDLGNSGTAKTVTSAVVGGTGTVVMTGTPVVFTFPTPVAGQKFRLRLTQDGTGTRLATWPASVRWPAGTAPTLTTTAGRHDAVEFFSFDGLTWYGRTIGLAYVT